MVAGGPPSPRGRGLSQEDGRWRATLSPWERAGFQMGVARAATLSLQEGAERSRGSLAGTLLPRERAEDCAASSRDRPWPAPFAGQRAGSEAGRKPGGGGRQTIECEG